MLYRRELDEDVVTAAKQRIVNIFRAKLPVYVSFSGGKDSLCLAHLCETLVKEGRINSRQLVVEFIDEEAIFPCVEAVNHEWRRRINDLGARFDWYCLEVKHYSCLNQLDNDESFICWDRFKRGVWVREPPDFAVRSHPLLRPRKDSYQAWSSRVNTGFKITGTRAAESVQRLQAFARWTNDNKKNLCHPLYDWKEHDVWKYLSEHHDDVTIPDAYLHLYGIGAPRNRLRISQFFSVDTAWSLTRMAEFYPDLMERILKREPNAYIVSLYWDSEMFRRSTHKRKQIERTKEVARPDSNKTWREKVIALLSDIPRNFPPGVRTETAYDFRRVVLFCPHMEEEHYRQIWEVLQVGDPKTRVRRSLVNNVNRVYALKNLGRLSAAPAGHERPSGAAPGSQSQ
jgi:predicted phosphoadenosine phosphosulfate sulfurtransferase